MKISPARIAAYEILTKIEIEKAYSSFLLPQAEEKLDARDRALCHELTLGTLRKQILIDRIIEILTRGKKIDTAIRIILRFSLYQLKYLDKIPAHAAINDAVNLVQKAKKTSAKNFVNAILRRFTREKIELKFSDEIEKVSVESSHPRWLIEKWINQFGFDAASQLAQANNHTPELSFRLTAKTNAGIENSLHQENIAHEIKYLRDLAEHGKIYFQDQASQMVAEAVGLQSDERFLDVCCAPASKFSLVNYLIGGKPQQLFVGGDVYLQRLATAKNNCIRTGVQNYQLIAYDAEKSLPFADHSFDVILLDAPCSGTGTIRHNPEIRYFLEPKDFAELFVKQLKILTNASKLLKKGGRIIYSTCSLEAEENESVIENFLRDNGGFEKSPIKLPAHFLNVAGFAKTFPPRDKMDGFFIAAISRR